MHHALVVIFLEFFAWGLLTTPMITVSAIFHNFACVWCRFNNFAPSYVHSKGKMYEVLQLKEPFSPIQQQIPSKFLDEYNMCSVMIVLIGSQNSCRLVDEPYIEP